MCYKRFAYFAQTHLLRYTGFVGFPIKFFIRGLLNALALYLAIIYVVGFSISGGTKAFVIAVLILTILNTFLRPILRLISTPLVWLSLGLFNVAIHMFLLWIANQLHPQVTIIGFSAYFKAAVLFTFANMFF